jgi:sulfite reductase (ferredoxin)
VADWGSEKFREVLEKEYLGRALPDCTTEFTTPAHRDHIGVEQQLDGNVAIGATTRSGRTSGTDLTGLADLAVSVGSPGVSLTAQQGVIVRGVAPQRAEQVIDGLSALNLAARPSAFQRGTMACTGIEFCKLAIVETKARAEGIRKDLEHRLPDFDTPITINVNGCPNSCARFQVADIGFKGIVTRAADGSDQEAFQVHLGGQLGTNAAFGRKFRGLKVTADEASDYAERVLTGFLERREGEESFASYVVRAEESWLL